MDDKTRLDFYKRLEFKPEDIVEYIIGTYDLTADELGWVKDNILKVNSYMMDYFVENCFEEAIYEALMALEVEYKAASPQEGD